MTSKPDPWKDPRFALAEDVAAEAEALLRGRRVAAAVLHADLTAEGAETADAGRMVDEAAVLWHRASRLYDAIAREVPPELPRMRSAVAVSAVACATRASNVEITAPLAAFWLATASGISDEARGEIRAMLRPKPERWRVRYRGGREVALHVQVVEYAAGPVFADPRPEWYVTPESTHRTPREAALAAVLRSTAELHGNAPLDVVELLGPGELPREALFAEGVRADRAAVRAHLAAAVTEATGHVAEAARLDAVFEDQSHLARTRDILARLATEIEALPAPEGPR